MLKEKKWYFSVKSKGSNTFIKDRQTRKFTDRAVSIGETADCDIRFDDSDHLPEYYASILLNDDGQSWRIVKRTAHIDITIDGKGNIGYAQQLSDGDVIRFGGQEVALLFKTRHDDRYDEEDGGTPKTWLWAAAIVACAIIAGSLLINQKQVNTISEGDVAALEESIMLVRVDSVQQLLYAEDNEELQRPTLVLTGDIPTGTAFLTTDGRLVTARHCIEYWLGRNLDLTTKVAELKDDDVVKWAIETESYNQTHEDTMKMKVYFSVYDFMGDKKFAFASTDPQVHINTEHDGIFQLADFSDDYYWRSIRPYFNNKEMALGDVVWIDIEEKGKVKIASMKEVRGMQRGTQLMICGYPMTGTDDRKVIFSRGTLVREVSADNENLFVESNINHGFSGGPLMMKSGNDVVAVGIVSRVDSVSSGLYKWAVPVTEIQKGDSKDE